jgi:hypothetical protein
VICYSTAAVTLLAIDLVARQRLAGLPADAWIKIAALTLGAQLLGHTMFNRALKTVSATIASVCILLEVPTAAVIAWLWLGQVPSALAIPGAVLILTGLTVVAVGSGAPAAVVVAVGEPGAAAPEALTPGEVQTAAPAVPPAPADEASPGPRAEAVRHAARGADHAELPQTEL